MNAINQRRLQKLETAAKPTVSAAPRVQHVVQGAYEEREAEIARMIETGAASDRDIFHCVLSAAECTHRSPENEALRARSRY